MNIYSLKTEEDVLEKIDIDKSKNCFELLLIMFDLNLNSESLPDDQYKLLYKYKMKLSRLFWSKPQEEQKQAFLVYYSTPLPYWGMTDK